MSALSLLSGVKRKSGLRAVRSVVDPIPDIRRDRSLRPSERFGDLASRLNEDFGDRAQNSSQVPSAAQTPQILRALAALAPQLDHKRMVRSQTRGETLTASGTVRALSDRRSLLNSSSFPFLTY
jgi:hypothetical protein